LLIVSRMAFDLSFGTEVIGRPIVRESDGLAMSSRNVYLTPEQRKRATALWKALQAVRAKFAAGERDLAALEALARRIIEEAGLRLDYAEIRDPIELQRPARGEASSRLFLAAFIGDTRLIDNGELA
jgi:pantoate--beta-alanine ligase